MNNILIVFTGGTIGSTSKKGNINTSEKQGYKLLNLVEKQYPDSSNLSFTTIQPLQILSENLFPLFWEKLIKAIEAENISNCDGIIITHGTDTLAFTAAALGLYFNDIKIPLLLVSSNHPLDHPQANGLNNFICAIEFIKQRKQAGVFVPYKNQNSATLIHLGTRLASSLQLTGDFISVQSKAYLRFENNTFQPENELNSPRNIPTPLKAHFSTGILLIKPYPGLDYSQFNLKNVDVVLHDLYHSGTACSIADGGENYSLTHFIEKCKQLNISLYMAPAIKHENTYHSTQLLLNQGAKIIWNMSLEAAYVKLLLAYGNCHDSLAIDQFLSKNIAYEIIDLT